MARSGVFGAMAVVAYVAAACALAGSPASQVGVVSHIKVLSDKVEDVSSPEAWQKTYIRPGMSDQEKRHEHLARSPREVYTIRCGPKTVVKSFTVELAP